jgi:hypothetical protein
MDRGRGGMAEQTVGETATTSEKTDVEEPLTLRVVASGIVGGTAGVVAVSPILAGIPLLLGVFQLDPLEGFAQLVIADASAVLGIAFFVVGGAIVLPLFFIVTATYLPPQEPRYLRGSTIAVLFWTTFVVLFWPGGGPYVTGLYVVVTLVGHVLYGAILGVTMERLGGIPEHQV